MRAVQKTLQHTAREPLDGMLSTILGCLEDKRGAQHVAGVATLLPPPLHDSVNGHRGVDVRPRGDKLVQGPRLHVLGVGGAGSAS